MNNTILLLIVIAATFAQYGFEGRSVTAKTESESSSNICPTSFTGANLTGAIFGGVSLDGIILCNTTMPDGTIKNSSCKN